MTRDDLLADLRALERVFETRVEIWRVVINPDGNPDGREVRRIYRGSFYRPRGGEPPTKG